MGYQWGCQPGSLDPMRVRVAPLALALGLLVGMIDGAPGATQAPDDTPTPRDPAAAAKGGRDAGASQSNRAPASGVSREGSAGEAAAASPGSLVTYRVFATQYQPLTAGSVEVAVPDKCAKFAALRNSAVLAQFGCPDGYALGLDWRVNIGRDNGRSAVLPVRDVGPWNLDDNYWDGPAGSPRPRRLFTDLPRGRPEAQAAFFDDYNLQANCKDLNGNPTGRTDGADQMGRCVLNPAGIDLSVAAAAQLGLGPGQNEWVNVTFLWETTDPGSKPIFARGAMRYLRQTRTTGVADYNYHFGDPGDIAVMGDWDGNGTKTPGLFRAGRWYLRNSNSTGIHDITFGFGDPGDVPVVGDWNGDGRDTPGLFRAGRWLLRNSNTTGVHDLAFGFGNPGDVTVVGDWNADGRDTPGLFRSGQWLFRNSNTTGVHEVAFHFGDPGDVPVIGDWNADGRDTPGLFRSGQWLLRNSNTTGVHDVAFHFGDPGDRPSSWR